MPLLSNVGLLPNGHDVAWLVLALLVLAGIAKLWAARKHLDQSEAAPNTAQQERRKHNPQQTSSWEVALAQRFYWVVSLVVLVCLLASLRLPMLIVETLQPTSAPLVTLHWGDWPLANLRCSKQQAEAPTSNRSIGNNRAISYQLCATPPGMEANLSPYHEDAQLAPTVFENGLGFWGLRSSEAVVADKGFGRFHLVAGDNNKPTVLWYSASDATSPTTNQRAYQFHYPISFSPWVQWIGWLICLPLLISMVRRLGTAFADGSALSPYPGFALHCLFLTLLALVCLTPLWQLWAQAGSRFAIAGFLPWSDGSDWFNGLNHLLSFNELDSWTVRRPLNPVFLAGLFHLADLDWSVTLIIRALLLAASFAFLCRVLLAQFGALPTLAALAVGSVFAQDFIPVALTEPQGLIFAATGFAWLIVGASHQRLWCYLLGVSLISLALTLRLGPAGLLGAFILWPLFGVLDPTQRWRWVGLTVLAVVIGLAPTWLWTALFYSGENLPGANFAYTLYGLAYGGAPWTLFAEHYPTLANLEDSEVIRLVWQQAFAKIQAEPLLLLQGFAVFIANYFKYFFVFFESPIQTFMRLLFAVGVASCCLNAFGKSSQPLARLALLSWLGVLGTAPLIYWSLDAYRAFAVSLPLDMLLVAAGVHALLLLPKVSWGSIYAIHAPDLRSWSLLSITLVLLVSIIPLWAMQQRPIPNMASLTHVQLVDPANTSNEDLVSSATQADSGCRTGQTTMLLDLGGSSPLLTLSTNPTQRTWINKVNYQQFRYDPSFYHNEIASQLLALMPGDRLIHGFNFAAHQTKSNTQVWVVLPYTPSHNSNELLDGLHQVCVEPFDSSAPSNHYRVYRAMSWTKVI